METGSNADPATLDVQFHAERLARLIRLAARGFNRALQIRLSTEGVLFGHWIFLRIL